MNVLGRAQLQRTVVVVVALLLAAGFGSAVARDAAPIGSGDECAVAAIPVPFHRAHTEGAKPASAGLIERIRKVE